MKIVSLKEAREKDLVRYYTGKPCKHGHVSERFTKCRSCCECKSEKNHLPENKKARRDYADRHPEQMKQYARDWESRNKHKRDARRLDPEYQKTQYLAYKRWSDNNPDRAREKGRRYCKKHPGKINAKTAKRHADRLLRTPPWVDLSKIKKIYEECARKSKESGIPHNVDHDIPLRGEFVSGLHIAENLVIMEAIENQKKGNNF